MSLTGANTTPLGRLHPILAGKNEQANSSPNSLFGQKRQSMNFMPPGGPGGERKRKKKSRWGNEEEKTYIPGMPTSMPPNLTVDQQKAYITQLKIEEISRMLRTGELGIPQNPEERSPSPEPIYNSEGKRLNTREFRVRKNLEEERHNLIQEAIKLNPDYKPPSDYKPPMIKIQDKVMIPQDENPDVNFIGLLIGPRGNTLKKMEKESGAKIMIRGKGSVKEGKQGRRDGQPNPGEDEALHAMVTGPTQQSVKKAVEMIQDILKQGIEAPEGQNDLKRMQLRELAALNGTLRDDEILRCRNCGSSAHRHWECPEQRNVTNNVVCTHCGGAGHVASDCVQKDLPPVPNLPLDRAKMDSEYLSLMAELGEGVPNSEGQVQQPPPPKPMGGPPAPSPAIPLGGPTPPNPPMPNNFNRMEGSNQNAPSSGPPPPWVSSAPKPLMSTPVSRPTDNGNARPGAMPPWANKPGLLPVPGTPPRGMGPPIPPQPGAPPPPPPSGSSPFPGGPPPGGAVPPPPPPPASGGIPPWQAAPSVPPWQNPAAGFAPPPPPGFAPFQPPPPPPPPSDAPWAPPAMLGNLPPPPPPPPSS